MKNVLFLAMNILSVFFVSCNNLSEKGSSPNSSARNGVTTKYKSDSELINSYEVFKQGGYSIEQNDRTVSILKANNEHVFLTNSTTRGGSKLIIQTVNLSGDTSTEFLFCASDNESILYSYIIGADTSNTILTTDKRLISFLYTDRGFVLNNLTEVERCSKISTVKLIFDQYNVYWARPLHIPAPPKVSSPNLIVVSDELNVYDGPSSKNSVRSVFKKGTTLFYLDTNNVVDTVGGDVGIWYKVHNEKKKITGWVFGVPKNVSFYTDDGE